MEKPRDNPRRPSNQSGVYEQPYASDGTYDGTYDPFNDEKNGKSVKDSFFIEFNLYSSV